MYGIIEEEINIAIDINDPLQKPNIPTKKIITKEAGKKKFNKITIKKEKSKIFSFKKLNKKRIKSSIS